MKGKGKLLCRIDGFSVSVEHYPNMQPVFMFYTTNAEDDIVAARQLAIDEVVFVQRCLDEAIRWEMQNSLGVWTDGTTETNGTEEQTQ